MYQVNVPRAAFRPSAIFLAIVALFATAGVMLWMGFGHSGINVFLFVVAGWLVSLCLHEYAHALTAYRGGDHGVAGRGYLTLNPLKYAHPLLSIVLPTTRALEPFAITNPNSLLVTTLGLATVSLSALNPIRAVDASLTKIPAPGWFWNVLLVSTANASSSTTTPLPALF